MVTVLEISGSVLALEAASRQNLPLVVRAIDGDARTLIT